MKNQKEGLSITDLKQLNEELENYFQSTIIPQLFFDRDLKLRKYSPAAMKQFNLNTSSIGKYLQDLSTNLNYQTLEDDINKCMSLNKVIEKEIQTSDDKWYRMNVLPYILKRENKTNGVILTFVDINNYVLNLQEFHKLILEHEIFIYSVSHDLKAPLQSIDGLIDALKETINKNDFKEIDRLLTMLKSSANKMKELIEDLTNIGRKQSDNTIKNKKYRFNDLLDEINLTLKYKIEESNAKIECDFEIEEIDFPRKDLRSILYNLVSNAIKYRSEDRSLVVSLKTRREKNFIILSVKDNGRGIEEDKKGIIFSRFTRVIDNVEGTGVGLFLVSRIVDAQGGKIIVNSKVNEGSEFIIYLKQ